VTKTSPVTCRDADTGGRDGGTDLAVLRLSDGGSDYAAKPFRRINKPGNFVLALGRRGRDGVTASFGVSRDRRPWQRGAGQ